MRLVRRVAYWVAVIVMAALLTYALTRLVANLDESTLQGAAGAASDAMHRTRAVSDRL